MALRQPQRAISGLLYGVAVYVFMNHVVLPCRRSRSVPSSQSSPW